MAKPIEIKVGRGGPFDPVAGSSSCIIPSLKGIEAWVEKIGYGPYPYNLYTLRSGGGFDLGGGIKFEGEEYWYVHASGILVDNGDGGTYTNGFNYPLVMNKLFGRLGYKASTLPDQLALNSNNTTARSNRYFNDFHAIVTIPNLLAILDNPRMTADEFNAELEVFQRGVIMRALTAVFGHKEIIEQVLLFDRYGSNDVAIEPSGSFAGYRINVANMFDKAVQIDSAVFLFDADATFNLYLFKDGKKTALWSQEITVTANESTVFDFEDLILNYITPETKGGRFYLGYFQEDLGAARAIMEEVECWNKTILFGAEPFYSKKVDGQLDFVRNQVSLPARPMGFNLQVSSFSDWTGMITQRPNMFDELIGLCNAYAVIEKMIWATSSNGTERILKDGMLQAAAVQDLTGQAPVSDGPPPITGLNTRIIREAKRVYRELFPKVKAINVSQ